MKLFGKRVNAKLIAVHTALAFLVFFSFQSFEYYSESKDENYHADTPIYLSYLNAEPDKNLVRVEWKTHREENTLLFTLERSTDGQIYNLVDTVTAAGNSRTNMSYTINDDRPKLGQNYYRIKQTKKGGIFSYTEPVSVTKTKYIKSMFTITTTFDDRIFEIHIESYYTELNILLFNEKGELVFTTGLDNNVGEVNTRLDFSEIKKPGKYFVKLDAGNDIFIKEIELR